MAGKLTPVDEWEARGEIRQVYEEIKATLRVPLVNLNFKTWAYFPRFFPAMWREMRRNAESLAFEQAGDAIRAEAVRAAASLGRLDVPGRVRLTEREGWEIAQSLLLYHYINPKLLVFTSAVGLALRGEPGAGEDPGADADRPIERGVPDGMIRLKMVPEEPGSRRLRSVFREIRATLKLESLNSDYRTLAYWPGYLEAAWEGLKPVVRRSEYRQAADRLRERSRALARTLPHRVDLDRGLLERMEEPADRVLEVTDRFERLLPGLILNIALLALDWRAEDALRASPFPAPASPSEVGTVW